MRKLVAVLFVILILAGGYFTWNTLHEITPANISQVVISDLASGYSQSYSPEELDTEILLRDLKGREVDALPQEEYRTYSLDITNSWGMSRKYTAYFFKASRSVYIEDREAGSLYLVENPAFLSVHEIFNSLYDYRSAPYVEWFSGIDDFEVRKEFFQWQYKKWDGSWHEVDIEQIPDDKGNQVYTISSSDIEIRFDTNYPPDSILLEVLSETGSPVLKEKLTGSTIPVMNGEGTYTYTIRLEWEDRENYYKGAYSCNFALCVDFPPVFNIVNSQVTQGELIEVRAYHVNEDEEPYIKQSLFNKFKFFRDGDSYVGFIPTGYYTSPGEYEIELGVTGGNAETQTLTVKPRGFHIQYLYIDKSIESSTRNDEAYAEYDKYFVPVRLTSHDEAYYTDSFVIPAKGRLSTEYGETRYVNDSPTSYRHSGLDIGAPTGTPIYAVNNGKVVLARHLIMTGYTIVIDHGLGLFSVYFHLDKLLVEQGSMVQRGQQIGEMGSTGFSTGPHLHLTMSYYDTNIEPGFILVGEPITYENYKNYLE